MAVGFVFEAGDFFSGADGRADYGILSFWVELYGGLLFFSATEEFHFYTSKSRQERLAV